jgi:hypothetical protein
MESVLKKQLLLPLLVCSPAARQHDLCSNYRCPHLDQHQLINRQHSTKLLCVIIAAAAVAAAKKREQTYSKQRQITSLSFCAVTGSHCCNNGQLVISCKSASARGG